MARFGSKFIDRIKDKKNKGEEKVVFPVIPKNINVINVTAHTVEVSWEPGNDETSWEIVIQENNKDKPAIETGTYTSSNTHYKETDLLPSKDYEIYIRVNNNSDESIWATPIKFTTLSSLNTEFIFEPNSSGDKENSVFGKDTFPNQENDNKKEFNPEPLNEEDQADSVFNNKKQENINEDLNKTINSSPNRDPVPPPQNPSSESTLTIDADYVYFFTFGLSTAGKTAMLSGVLYYMETSRIGRLRTKGDERHQKRGKMVLNQMRKKVKSGVFVDRTSAMDATAANLPTEINLKFEPADSNKPDMPFCLMEMAGEDLDDIKLTEDVNSGDFDDRIKAYLTHPECMLAFICVIDTDLGEEGGINPREESESIIMEFLDYLHEIGHTTNPILISVNKWDKIADQYENVESYLRKEHPLLYGALADRDRDEVAITKFSIGEVDKEGATYEYNSEDSKTIFNWMYRIVTGVAFNKEISFEKRKTKTKTSLKEKLSKGFKNMMSNE
ncbi:fibronectin type III domain-containing protein [Tenacibaculum agarivorans]|uniref:fibronectin type III domain-containing protein n=1 Tax=Tenacibaculum agarivorans TaxID=1908389 RepID=UPI00094B8DAA|nr:fibronectin type III domain-containing protein [Tenacibaculum agarivorans]